MKSAPRTPEVKPPLPPTHQLLAKSILKVQDWLMKTMKVNQFILIDKKHGITYGDIRATAMAAVGMATISEKLPPNARGSATLIDALDDRVMLNSFERVGGTLDRVVDKDGLIEWQWTSQDSAHTLIGPTLRDLLADVRRQHDHEETPGGL